MVDLAKLVKGAATSRTLHGGVGLFGMLAANIRLQGTLWIGTTPFPLEDDGNVILALIGLFFVV